jgi:4-alpha-glucanotransferase
MATKPTLTRRLSGVLLHPTSLPGRRGGALGAEALAFAEFLADCGQSWWQVLPVCPPDGGGSPYNSISSFAGSPALISVDLLAAEGLLKKSELGQPQERALRLAFENFARRGARDDFDRFRAREAGWLADHALFLALRDVQGGRSWVDWDEPLRRREDAALAAARERLSSEVRLHEFVQWLFARQWDAVRRHASARGVALIGDAPIYVSHDSADVWAHQGLFFLDASGRSTAVAGVPPDYFSETGQLWGNPLYRWSEHASAGFAWWVSRLAVAASRFDAIRLDHFIGFKNYWEVPVDAKTAVGGRWVDAPGEALFETVRRELPGLEIIAEDLGVLTPPVEALRDRFGFPGMKIAQFSFGEEKDGAARWPERSVAYTGTHDNETARAWFEDDGSSGRKPDSIARERAAFLRAVGGELPDGPAWAMTRYVWRSPSRLAMAPMQDLLGLGAEARMNRPGSMSGNWLWRMTDGALTVRLAGRLGAMTGAAGRAPEGI